jgi:hypothetical protein
MALATRSWSRQETLTAWFIRDGALWEGAMFDTSTPLLENTHEADQQVGVTHAIPVD